MYDIDKDFRKCQICKQHTISEIRKKCYLGLKKVLGKFAGSEKVATFATAFERETPNHCKTTGSEKVLKKVSKSFGGLKNLTYLCTRFRLKTKAVF